MEQRSIARQVQETLPPDKVVSRLAEWFRRMSESGLSIDDLQDPIDDPAMRKRLVSCWQSRAYISTGPFYDGWQQEEAFAKPKLDVRWYLLWKEAVPGTKGKSFSDQLPFLPSDEYLPSACEVLYAAYLYYAVRGMFLFQGSRTEGEDVRTRDEHFRGGRVTVGARYSHCNVYLGDYDDSAHATIGLAGSCRVPDTVAP